jgi:hypothetical protein
VRAWVASLADYREKSQVTACGEKKAATYSEISQVRMWGNVSRRWRRLVGAQRRNAAALRELALAMAALTASLRGTDG